MDAFVPTAVVLEKLPATVRTVVEDLPILEEVAKRSPLRSERKKAAEILKQHRRLSRILAAGYEPTTPPKHWYCGSIKELSWGKERASLETWPARNIPSSVFTGIMPLEVQEKVRAAKHHFAWVDMAVYSPDVSAFKLPQYRIDPVVVARLETPGYTVYFEIVRWDTSEDLAHQGADQ